jgi:hypothetical protein
LKEENLSKAIAKMQAIQELIGSGMLTDEARQAADEKLAKVLKDMESFDEDEDEGPGGSGGKTQRQKEDNLVAALAALGFEDAGKTKDELLEARGPEKLSKGAAEEE